MTWRRTSDDRYLRYYSIFCPAWLHNLRIDRRLKILIGPNDVIRTSALHPMTVFIYTHKGIWTYSKMCHVTAWRNNMCHIGIHRATYFIAAVILFNQCWTWHKNQQIADKLYQTTQSADDQTAITLNGILDQGKEDAFISGSG